MEVFVSVIIPNYNHSRYLEERIHSILAQTYNHFEIIILDDCSTDQSKNIIEKFRSNSKIAHIVYNEVNTGNTFLQWQKGIELARGEWIWIAESDDYCENSILQELLDGSNKISDCTLSYCQSIMFNENNILWISNSPYLKHHLNGRAFVKEYMLSGNSVFNASMCIFKREKYFTMDKEFTKYKYSGDWLFWIEIALQGNVYISGKTLNYFRKHPNDVSSLAFKSGLGYLDYFIILHYLEQNHLLVGNKYEDLLYKKFKQFLLDKRIDKLIKQEIGIKFKTSLNYYLYYSGILWLILLTQKSRLKGLFINSKKQYISN